MNSTKKDILFIHHQPIISGSIQSLLLLINYLKKNNFNIKVLFLQTEGNALPLFKKAGIEYFTNNDITTYAHAYGAYRKFLTKKPWQPITLLIKTFYSVKKAREILNQHNPNLIYLNSSVLIPFAIAAKQLNIKVIWHLREQIHDGIIGIRKKIIQYLFRNYATKIISISKVNANSLGLNNIEVIYNSVDFNIFNHQLNNKEWEEKYNLKDKIVVSFVGGNLQSKGADIFINTAVQLKKVYGDKILFILSGNFNTNSKGYQNKIDRFVLNSIESNNMLDSVIFTGVLNNISNLLSVSNILVWSANVPHFARPILEAMAMGVPVVATNFQSSQEIITNEKDGLLAEKNYLSFAKSIERIINDVELYKKIQYNSLIKAKQLFDAEQNNYLISNIITKIL